MKKLLTGLLISATLLSGCASQNKITEEKYSGFLDNYSDLKPTPKDKDTLAYIAPNIDWSIYNSGMVDDVLIITPDGSQEVDDKLLLAIANEYKALIDEELSKRFKIVDKAGTGTIRIQAAITGVYTSYDDLKGYQYIPIAAAVTGAARASGANKKKVRIVTEIKMIDSVNGQLLIQAVDLKTGAQESNGGSSVTLADVRPVLVQWAQRLTDRVVSLKNILKDR